ncbi:MAG: preprotein translocase subunit SecG [Hyphomonadaceae bacterium]|nr:preprotein translocase subunit SecG [Hyphomonadaceae bacterium]
MQIVILSIHLLVCLCLIGLVLLQRSEGGALGMGGGGGSLMSGRGAADALAKMTQVAGFFFLVTSLSLTVLSGAASSSSGRSVFDTLPQQTAPASTAPAAAAPPATTTAPAPQQPDPTQSQAEPSTQLASAIMPGPAPAAAAPSATTARAAPLETRPTPPAASSTPRSTPASAPATTRATPPPAQQRTAAVTQRPATTNNQPLVLPNTSGAALTLDNSQLEPESGEAARLEAVRRERAGPDQ